MLTVSSTACRASGLKVRTYCRTFIYLQFSVQSLVRFFTIKIIPMIRARYSTESLSEEKRPTTSRKELIPMLAWLSPEFRRTATPTIKGKTFTPGDRIYPYPSLLRISRSYQILYRFHDFNEFTRRFTSPTKPNSWLWKTIPQGLRSVPSKTDGICSIPLPPVFGQ